MGLRTWKIVSAELVLKWMKADREVMRDDEESTRQFDQSQDASLHFDEVRHVDTSELTAKPRGTPNSDDIPPFWPIS